MAYIRKVSSLEEKAAAQLAITLCQENDFKEVALWLEKPTYGAFIHPGKGMPFVSDPEILSEWDKIKHIDWQCSIFLKSCYPDNIKRLKQWDTAVDEQSEKLTKGLPSFLKHRVQVWIKRIALEYLSYCQRLEILFGVSRYFLMNILSRGDWMEAARLNEVKLGERLVNDERLTVLTRYRIACIYYIQENIFSLGKKISFEEQQCSNDQSSFYTEINILSLFWSIMLEQDEKVIRKKMPLWISLVEKVVCYGNQASVMLYWKELDENTRHDIVVNMALRSLEKWQGIHIGLYAHNDFKERLLSNVLTSMRLESVQHFNLPSYYNELVFFFLSKMDEEQQLIFFTKAFETKHCDSTLECFLDWPHEADFLPMINRLWKILPMNKYGQCLLALASKYSGSFYRKHSCSLLYMEQNYDYRSLLWSLWEQTPEEYKQYVFRDKFASGYPEKIINEGKILLLRLLERSPFLEKDKALFKQVLQHLPKKERIAMMFSKAGEEMCCTLIQKENLSLVNWLLEECMPKKKIQSCKKQFIQSDCGRRFCFSKLKKNCEKLLENLIDWSLELDTEKTQFKCKLVDGDDCLYACESLLTNGKFTEVDRIINYCLSSDEMKKQVKTRFTKSTCNALIEDLAWEQMDKIFVWCCDTEEEIRDIKKGLLSDEGVYTHYILVFNRKDWKGVEYFYKWFCLSPAEIKEIKKETIFQPECVEEIDDDLRCGTDLSLESLRWCITDEEMVISLKKVVNEQYFTDMCYEEKEKARKHLDYLVSELLSSLRKEDVYDQTRQESDMKDKGDKRSSIVMENESSLPRKRFK